MPEAPAPLLPMDCVVMDAHFALYDGHILHRSPYSGRTAVVRTATGEYRGQLRLRINSEAGDDEAASWWEVHSLSAFGVEIWRFDGGHDLPALPQMAGWTALPSGRSQWHLAPGYDADQVMQWIDRLTVARGRVFRILEFDEQLGILTVTPGAPLTPPFTPEPPGTAAIRVQQVNPNAVMINHRDGFSQDIIVDLIEVPGRIVGISPVRPVDIPDHVITWMGRPVTWRGKYITWNAGAEPGTEPEIPRGALTWMGRYVTWRGKYITLNAP